MEVHCKLIMFPVELTRGPAAVRHSLFRYLCSISLPRCAWAPFTDTAPHSLSDQVETVRFSVDGHPSAGSTIVLYATGVKHRLLVPTLLAWVQRQPDASGNFQDLVNAPSCANRDPQQVLHQSATGGNLLVFFPRERTTTPLHSAWLPSGNCSSVSASTHVVINEVSRQWCRCLRAEGLRQSNRHQHRDEFDAQPNRAPARISERGKHSGRQYRHRSCHVTPGGKRYRTGKPDQPRAARTSDSRVTASNSASRTSPTCTGPCPTRSRLRYHRHCSAAGNTWQVMRWMAQYPGNNTANLFGTILATPSFQPTIGSTAPNDLSIGIAYTAGLGNDGTTAAVAPWGIAADANDNIWVSGATKAGLIELSSTGALLSPNGGWGNVALQNANFTHQVAVDRKGNIWTVDSAASGGNIYQYKPGTAVTTVTTPGTLALAGVAVDGSNNIWYSTKSSSGTQIFGQLAYNSGSDTFAATPTVFTGSNVIDTGGVYALTVDAVTGNVWGPSQGAGITNYFLSPYTAPVASVTTSGTTNYAAAIDKSGNTWITNTVTGGNNSSIFMVTHGNPSGSAIAYSAPTGTALGLDGLRSIAIDGNNRIFLSAYTANTIVEFDPVIGTTGGHPGTFLLTSAGNGFNPSSNTASTGVINSDRTSTIDASGALWTVNASGTQPVVQVLGIAAPTVSVLALGKYGVRP